LYLSDLWHYPSAYELVSCLPVHCDSHLLQHCTAAFGNAQMLQKLRTKLLSSKLVAIQAIYDAQVVRQKELTAEAIAAASKRAALEQWFADQPLGLSAQPDSALKEVRLQQ
jgi:hypothetical protein